MSPLLAPLFAQLITLQVGDRTEARYVKYELEQFEGTTSPQADLAIKSGRTDVALGYGPNVTLMPLEKKPRQLLVFHEANASVGYRWRASSLRLESSLGFGQVNFRLLALQGTEAPEADGGDTADQPDGGATDQPGGGAMDQPGGAPSPDASGTPDPNQPSPNDPTTGQLRIVDQVVKYYLSNTTLTLNHAPTKVVLLSAQVGHSRAGGLDHESRLQYPELHAWFVGVTAGHTYRLTGRDAFVSSTNVLQTWSSNGNKTATLTVQEDWQHMFSARTAASLGAGINITRFSQEDGLRGFSIFPTFQGVLEHRLLLWRGTLSFSANAYSSPALDPLRALVDPRVGVGGRINYTRKRFSIDVSGSTGVSLAPEDHDAGAVDAAQAEGRIAYRLAELLEVDAGGRYARQAVQGVTVLPSSYAAFVGLNVGYLFRLAGARP